MTLAYAYIFAVPYPAVNIDASPLSPSEISVTWDVSEDISSGPEENMFFNVTAKEDTTGFTVQKKVQGV